MGKPIVEHEVGKSKDSSFLLVWPSICIGILISIAFIFAKTLNIQILDEDKNIGIPYGWASLLLIVAFFPALIIWNKVYSQLAFVRKNWFDVKEWNRIEYFES
ncbi:hypothetical protein [Adhaeribacter radiodurans]|uniref:Uncharacterized protein n=1 Tax=Adhaeribacter radiodurans TaxID=2745197 RepID=A0A7L7L138_9BACT|nr:hypothetical protein [Adhaeribacter radiodurans]QMU26507.1 hypothetical protein HUW48_00085 [Adhaeribacter radiodurans]